MRTTSTKLSTTLVLCASWLFPTISHAASFAPTTSTELIAAIHIANSNAADDEIDLGGNTFTLSIADNGANGLPVILTDGGHWLVIRNGTLERSSSADFRFLELDAYAKLGLDSVTLLHGSAPLNQNGGAVLVGANANLLPIVSCRFEGNSAPTGRGGAIAFAGYAQAAFIAGSTFTGNQAGSDGGAISVGSALLGNVVGCTFDNNSADSGGAIAIENGVIWSITLSTISSNSAATRGGGISIANSSFGTPRVEKLLSSTIAGNQASISGGGISICDSCQIWDANNNILAANTAPSGPDLELVGSLLSESFNLIGDNSGSGIVAGTPNSNNSHVGTSLAPIDPQLAPLANNGGPARTHALLPLSDAHDAGENELGFGFDQRGNGYPRVRGNGPDIGAYEAQECAGDVDIDGSCDDADNCPITFNPLQPDSDNDGTGDECEHCPDAPHVGCDVPVSARLSLQAKTDEADSLRLTFKGAIERERTAFGNPLEATATLLCLYYDDSLAAEYKVPGDTVLWTNSPTRTGWKYSDKLATVAGISSIKERAGEVGDPAAPRIQIKGQGQSLPDPLIPVPETVSAVTAQVLNNTSSVCFTASFAAPFKTNAANGAATSARFQAVQ